MSPCALPVHISPLLLLQLRPVELMKHLDEVSRRRSQPDPVSRFSASVTWVRNLVLGIAIVFAAAPTVEAAIASRGTATAVGNTTLLINKPSGVVSGDVLFADLSSVGNATANATSSGWTLVAGADLAGPIGGRGTLLYKVAGASEPADYYFTFGSGTSKTAGGIVAFSGVNVTGETLFDVTPGAISVQASSASATATSITTISPNAAVVMFGMVANGTTTWSDWSTTSPGALTELFDIRGTNSSSGAAWALKATAGATGNGSATLSVADRNGAIMIALNPGTRTEVTKTTAGAGTWTAPPGVTSVTVEVWGGGGKGGARVNSTYGAGGGGGGAYAKKASQTVTPGTTYNFMVGAGSTSTAAGGDSWFVNATTVMAKGGASVANNTSGGASGGSASASIGDVGSKFNGGNGAGAFGLTLAGGGGSSAGIAANGTAATNSAGGTAPTRGGNGGNGRTSTTGSGSGGSVPGGGGGGALVYPFTSSASGGSGANGKLVISYTEPSAATKLAFGTQPATAVYGDNIASFTVQIQDAGSAVVTSDNSTTVTLAIANNAGPGGVLSGTFTSVTAVNGVATFSNIKINKIGTGYTLSATSSPSLTGATSSAFNITAKPITVTAVTDTKTYNGTTASSGTPTVSPALAFSDTAAFTQTFNTRNFGTGKTLTPAGVVSDGNSGANYSYTYSTVTNGSITPAALTYTANAASRSYGTSNSTFSGTVTGFVNSELLANVTTGTAVFTSAAAVNTPVGSHAINGSGLTANNGNYSFIQAGGNATALTITAPVFTSSATASVPENTTAVLTVVATQEAPPASVTYTKTGGADAAKFNLSSDGILTFMAPPDFESFGDQDNNNVYLVEATINDGQGSTASQLISVTVTNVNEMPSFVKGADQLLPYNTSSAQTATGWATGIDDGDSTATQALTFNISSTSNPGLFTTAPSIDSSTGTLTYTPNGTAGTATISVTLTDDASINGTAALTTASQQFTITVAPQPTTVTSVSPSFGSTAGGTSVTITGTGFASPATVTIGGVAATSVVVNSATSITCTTPAGTAGARDVVVTVSGQSSTGGTGLYTYTASGPLAALEAYLKAGNTGADDFFGLSVAVSGDTAVIGAPAEGSNATTVDGDGNNNGAHASGAAYVFTRSSLGTWSQQAYLKASNSGASDQFGRSVAISGDTAVIGALGEASNATTVDGDGSNNDAGDSGAAYVFTRSSGGTWSQQAYLKARSCLKTCRLAKRL